MAYDPLQALSAIMGQNQARVDDRHMERVFAANPAFAEKLYGMKNQNSQLALMQQEAMRKQQQQDALRDLAAQFANGGNAGNMIGQAAAITGDLTPLANLAISREEQATELMRKQALANAMRQGPAPTAGMGQTGVPLNVRSNNPGNMRDVKTGVFRQFATPEEGLAAMSSDLTAKVTGNSGVMKSKYGEGYKPTLQNVIETWAPPSENDTQKYVNFVAEQSGISPTQTLSPLDIQKIMPAMVKMEGGEEAAQYFSGAQQPVATQQPIMQPVTNPALDMAYKLAQEDEKFIPAYLKALEDSQKPAEPSTDIGKAQRDEQLGLVPKGTVDNLIKQKNRQIVKEEAEAKAAEQAAVKAREQEEVTKKVAETKMTEAVNLLENGGMNVGGLAATGSLWVPGKATDADKLNSIYSTLKSVISLDKLMEMKKSSPTGASGFGALSANELQLLMDSVAALDVELPAEDQKTNLKTISDILGIVSKNGAPIVPTKPNAGWDDAKEKRFQELSKKRGG